MTPSKMRQRILEDKPIRVLLVLAGPLILNYMAQVLYNIVDTFWLGRLGASAVSAPTVAWPIIMTVTFFGAGFTAAGLALISQYVGANRWEKVDRIVAQLLLTAAVLGTVFGILVVYAAPSLLHFMNAPVDVFPLALQYLTIVALAFPLTFIGYVFGTTLRSLGDTKTPMFVNFATIGLNAILDPLLIFGIGPFPELGVAGAAIATAVSNLVYAAVGLTILFKGWRHVHLRVYHFVPDLGTIVKILRLGTPTALANSLSGLGMTVIMGIVAAFGTIATAAYGIAMRVLNLLHAVIFATSQAGGIMIGQNIGAEQYERGRKILHIVVRSNIIIAAAIGVFLYVSAPFIIQLFISDPAVMREGVTLVRLFALTMPFFGTIYPVAYSLRAAGKTKLAAYLSFAYLWLIRIPSVFLLSRMLGMYGAWLGLAVANIGGALLASHFVFNTGWMRKVIE